MTIPTSGTYDGIDLYQTVASSNLPADAQAALDQAGLGDLTDFYEPRATDAAVSVDGNSISFTDDSGAAKTLNGIFLSGQSPSAVSFVADDGVQYVVSNGAFGGGRSLGDYLTALAASATEPARAEACLAARSIVDNDGLGFLQVFPHNGALGGGIYDPPACFASGTLITTVGGERAVETLAAGDRIVLATGGDAAIIWTGHRRVRPAMLAEPDGQRPVRIGAGALGDGLPRRDLLVSPDHALLIDGVLVPAGLLVDGASIRRDLMPVVTYHHVELDRHAALLAEGAAAETYVDTGNRHVFANAALVSLRPDMRVADRRDYALCAPMVLDGEPLAAIRARLAAVAATRLAS